MDKKLKIKVIIALLFLIITLLLTYYDILTGLIFNLAIILGYEINRIIPD